MLTRRVTLMILVEFSSYRLVRLKPVSWRCLDIAGLRDGALETTSPALNPAWKFLPHSLSLLPPWHLLTSFLSMQY